MPARSVFQDVARALGGSDSSRAASSILTGRAVDAAEAASPSSTGGLLSEQWTNPSDVLSVLMIIGGDIVQKALAESSGGLFTPVCFSFGWVAYSFTALVNLLGDGKLLPEPDYPVKVFNLENGYVRENRHWVIGRIARDNEVLLTRTHPLEGGALRISIYEAAECTSSAAVAGSGRVRVWSIITMLLQFGVAAIPVGLYREWGVIMVTGAGTLLALAAGALPQWTAEKIPSRRHSAKNFALSFGNGSRDIMIILGRGNSLDLEELASSESPRSTRIWEKIGFLSKPVLNADGTEKTHGNKVKVRETKMLYGIPLGFIMTGALCTTQCVFWIALLITVAGLKSHSWFILAIGALGMFQNAAVAAISRDPSKRNLPLIPVDHIVSRTVMDGLMDLEVTFPGQAQYLLDEFFPGKLRETEIQWWTGTTPDARDAYDDKRCKELARRGFPRSRMPSYKNSNNPGNGDKHRKDDRDTNSLLQEPITPITPTVQDNSHPKALFTAIPGSDTAALAGTTLKPISKTTQPEGESTSTSSLSPSPTDLTEKPRALSPAPNSQTSSEKPTSTSTSEPVAPQEPPILTTPTAPAKRSKGPVHFAQTTETRDFAPKNSPPTRAMTEPEPKSPIHEGKQYMPSQSLSVDEIYKIVQSPDWS